VKRKEKPPQRAGEKEKGRNGLVPQVRPEGGEYVGKKKGVLPRSGGGGES